MNRKKVVKHMMNELDFYVKHHDACNDPEVKADWENDYRQRAKAFNGLLMEMFPAEVKNGLGFRRTIEKYKEDREWRYE